MICENIVRIFLILSLFSSGEACDIPKPQKHGDWFCPPSTDPATCHLECHPGYVSTNATVITCRQNHHQWSEAPECITAVAMITGDAYRSNTVEDKQFELSDYKSTALEEKIEMKTNGTLVNESKLVKTNELLTSKNDKIERQINELIELFNSRNTEIEQLKEKTNALEEENKKITKLNNQQKGLISKMQESLVHVNGIVTMNQLDIEKNDQVITEYGKVITQKKGNVDDFFNWMQLMSIQLSILHVVECSGNNRLIYPGTITSQNHPGNYPANVDCSFTLIPRPGKSVHLEFTHFSTEKCVDYIEMDPPINGVSKFCGHGLSYAPPTTTFDVNQQVTLRFHTDGDTQYTGWNAIFNIV